jgi:hypothetical protein
MELRIDAYRRRMTAMLLLAPLVSLVIGVAMWMMSAGWMLPARTAARVCALANFALGLITLVPVPTFGARVWSDLAAAWYLWHATDAEIVEHALLSVQDRLVILLEWHETDVALSTARRAVAMAPDAPLAYCLLAFTLLNAGHREEAVGVARDALAGQVDDNSRAYLTQLVEEADRHETSK